MDGDELGALEVGAGAGRTQVRIFVGEKEGVGWGRIEGGREGTYKTVAPAGGATLAGPAGGTRVVKALGAGATGVAAAGATGAGAGATGAGVAATAGAAVGMVVFAAFWGERLTLEVISMFA